MSFLSLLNYNIAFNIKQLLTTVIRNIFNVHVFLSEPVQSKSTYFSHIYYKDSILKTRIAHLLPIKSLRVVHPHWPKSQRTLYACRNLALQNDIPAWAATLRWLQPTTRVATAHCNESVVCECEPGRCTVVCFQCCYCLRYVSLGGSLPCTVS